MIAEAEKKQADIEVQMLEEQLALQRKLHEAKLRQSEKEVSLAKERASQHGSQKSRSTRGGKSKSSKLDTLAKFPMNVPVKEDELYEDSMSQIAAKQVQRWSIVTDRMVTETPTKIGWYCLIALE